MTRVERSLSWEERLEAVLAHGQWPVRVARLLGMDANARVRGHRIRVHADFGGRTLRLGFATDFHAGPSTDPAALRSTCAALAAARIDVLLLGGDFVGRKAEYVGEIAPLLRTVPAPLGRFAVLGNHDHWAGADAVRRALVEVGCRVLVNEAARLPPPFDGVWICGLDDHWTGRPDGAAARAGADGVRVLLMHAPSGLLDWGEDRFEVALCGHTHGGQIALPGGVPLILPHGELSRRYARGRFELAGRGPLIVSVGVGCSVLPIRTFTPPEVLICELVGDG